MDVLRFNCCTLTLRILAFIVLKGYAIVSLLFLLIELVVGLVKMVCIRPLSMLDEELQKEWCAPSAQKKPAKSLLSRPLSQLL